MKQAIRNSAVVFGLLLAAGALAACPATLDDECAHDACVPGSGSNDGGRDGGPDATAVDDCVNKPDAPECLNESTAFFVADSKGDDATGDGTKAKPFKKLATALGKVTDAKRRIYVCDGTYKEDVVLDTKNGISLFGGFTCDWQKSDAKPTFGNSTTALKINGSSGVAIAGLAFVAKDATTPSGSSIAAFVNGGDVTFKNVSLTAGKGFKGDDGTLTEFTLPSASALHGTNGADGAPANLVTCPGDTMTSTSGGKGGANGFDGEAGTVGADNKGTTTMCGTNTGGGDGAIGAPGTALPSLTSRGQLLAAGWQASPGADGPKGGAGQGGGGGAGKGGGTGGGGGAGGCGGAGGGGGKGGGASIALASLAATVTLEASALNTNDAGNGGSGVAGQPGQDGGIGGDRTATACIGGNGGIGGTGAPGNGGAGGVSVGVLYKGGKLTTDPKTEAAFKPGAKGAAGAGPGNPGIEGVADLKLEAK